MAFRNAVTPLKMVSHEEPRKVYKYEGDKKIEGSEVVKIRCLFIRTYDVSWDNLNDDGTYPYCHACTVDLTENIFKLIQPGVDYLFACDISEDKYHRSSITPRKIRLGDQVFDLKTEDVLTIE